MFLMNNLLASFIFISSIDALSRPPVLQLNQNLTSNGDGTNPPSPIRTYCDPKIYGVPVVKSCVDAYNKISDNSDKAEFGDRSQGLYMYNLPYRFTSNDGKCVIDIDHMAFAHKDKRAKKDVASMSSIRAAALALLEGCMFARKAGGIRMGLGEEGALAVTLQEYEPDVTCQPRMPMRPDLDDCQEILQMMPTSEDVQMFGAKGEPGVEVELPFPLTGPKNKCGFQFMSNGGPQKQRWYDLWQAATAVWAVCGRTGNQGYATVGTKPKFIDAFMYVPPDDLHAPNTLNELNATFGGFLRRPQ